MHENRMIEDGESSTIVQTTSHRQRFCLCRNKFLSANVRGVLNASPLEGYGLCLHGDNYVMFYVGYVFYKTVIYFLLLVLL